MEIGDDVVWYAIEKFRPVLQYCNHINLLLMDGPKSINEYISLPALSFLSFWFDTDSLVGLDDAKRSKEQAVLMNWKPAFNFFHNHKIVDP